MLHDTEPPEIEEEIVVPELDETPFVGRSDLLAVSDGLLEHIWFDSWLFPYDETYQTMIQTPVPRRGVLTDHQIRPLVEHFMTPDLRATLRARLRRQAWLLDRGGDPNERDQALAVAAFLPDASMEELVTNRFVRKLVQVSVENAASAYYWGV